MLEGGAISRFSWVQKVTAAASSSESENVALAEVINGLRFLRQVKGFLTPSIDDNIVVREDNEGAIKMVTNRLSSRHTRYVDVKHHHVNSGVQHADVPTKALYVNTFKTHARVLLNAWAGSRMV